MIVAGDAHCWAVAQIRDVRVSASGINACQPCSPGGGMPYPDSTVLGALLACFCLFYL